MTKKIKPELDFDPDARLDAMLKLMLETRAHVSSNRLQMGHLLAYLKTSGAAPSDPKFAREFEKTVQYYETVAQDLYNGLLIHYHKHFEVK
jgi:hypothetical protein